MNYQNLLISIFPLKNVYFMKYMLKYNQIYRLIRTELLREG